MTILDIDNPKCRADSAERRPLSPGQALRYLEEHCGVNPSHPIPGAVVDLHHEVFDHWRDLIGAGDLAAPFDLVHILPEKMRELSLPAGLFNTSLHFGDVIL